MLSTNHGLAGILLGSALPLPVAAPAAFLSHFVMDVIPHYGIPRSERDGSLSHKLIIYGDVILAMLLNIPVLVKISWLPGSYHAWSLQLCGWIATSPDFALVYYWFTHGKTLNTYHNSLLKKLHLDFHYERKYLIIPELTLMAGLFALYFRALR